MEGTGNRSYAALAITGFAAAAFAAVAEVLAGAGTRWQWWDYRTGLAILRWAAYGGVAAVLISLAGCLTARPGGRRRGFVLSLLALLAGVIVVGIPWHYRQTAQRVPAIHDITTDTENPPRFVAVLPLRRGQNTAAYGGPKIAAQQRAAYPDLVPLDLSLPPAQAFTAALNAARARGWGIIAAEPSEGRIEASDRTFWFGFTDDIVIRVAAREGGSRIDIRSSSRVGKSDLGTNARRIHGYQQKVRETAAQYRAGWHRPARRA